MIAKKSAVITALFVVFLFLSPEVNAAYLYLDPSSTTVKPGTEFDIDLKINTEGVKPTTSDALIQFDTNNLKFIDVIRLTEDRAFFPELIERIEGDTIYVGAYIRLGSQPTAGDATIATLRFKALNIAQAPVNFLCTPGETRDSNISLKQNRKVTDVIDCEKSVNSMITITDGRDVPAPTVIPTRVPTGTGGTGITPSPTLPPSATPTASPSATLVPTAAPTDLPTPSVLPQTGIIETTQIVIMVGFVLTIMSILVKIYVS